MITIYEGALFDITLSDTYQYNLFKLSLYNPIKKLIGPFLGKPYRQDEILQYIFSSKKHIPVVIDVGCHVGAVALPIAKRFPNAKIICVDANPAPLAKFITNINLNRSKNIQLINAAISNEKKLLTIYPCSGNAGGARVTGFKGRPEESEGGGILVPSISIEEIFSFYKLSKCDFLKIDVEGYELSALRSAGALLQPAIIKTVIAEYGPEGCRSAGITGWDMVSYMLTRGYKCTDLRDNKEITCSKEVPFIDDYCVTNFLFTEN
jgi:FkbM family methyltransferase